MELSAPLSQGASRHVVTTFEPVCVTAFGTMLDVIEVNWRETNTW